MLSVADDPGREEHHHKERRQKHADPGDRRARKARDEVADEHGGDDNRSRRDHAHGHGVEEFALGEPAVVAHDPLLEERHDREPGPEGERSGLEEEDPELQEHVRIGGLRDERAESHRNRRRRDRESPKPARWRIEQHAEEPGEHEEHRHLAANGKRDQRDDCKDHPEPAVVLHRHPEQLPRAAEDQRDDRWADAVEERLDDSRSTERDVQRGDDADDDKWRQDERHGCRDRAPEPATHVAEPHRELRGERTGQGLRHGQALEVLLLREPAPSLHQIALHISGKGDRAAEPEASEANKVAGDLSQRQARRTPNAHALSS